MMYKEQEIEPDIYKEKAYRRLQSIELNFVFKISNDPSNTCVCRLKYS